MVRVRVRHPMADLRYGGPESTMVDKCEESDVIEAMSRDGRVWQVVWAWRSRVRRKPRSSVQITRMARVRSATFRRCLASTRSPSSTQDSQSLRRRTSPRFLHRVSHADSLSLFRLGYSSAAAIV